MKLGVVFDASQVRPSDPDGGQGNLPVGLNPCVIRKNEIAPNATEGTGHQIIFDLECFDGPGKGASTKWRLNLFHTQSAKAKEIAAEQLSALCHVTGVFKVDDLDELSNKPFLAVVESQNDPQHPNRTQIKGVLDMNGDKPGQPGVKGRAPVAQAAAPAQAAWAPAGGAAPAQAPAAPARPAAAAWAAPAGATAAPVGFARMSPAATPAAAPAAAPAWGAPAAAPAADGAPAWVTQQPR